MRGVDWQGQQLSIYVSSVRRRRRWRNIRMRAALKPCDMEEELTMAFVCTYRIRPQQEAQQPNTRHSSCTDVILNSLFLCCWLS